MADNVILPGAGEPIATDDAGAGGHVQMMKLAVADDGSRVALPATAADGLLVNLGANNDVVVSGTITANGPLTDAQMRASAVHVTVPGVTQTQDAAYVPGSIVMVGGLRSDGDVPLVSADGDVHPLAFNSIGRVKVSAMPGIYTPITGNIVANTQTVVADVARASNVMVHMVATSLVGHNCTFEGSINGGTNWFAVQAVRSNANTIETTTGVLAATPAYAWELSVNALTNFRIRATAHTSGTASWIILPGAYATEPIPAAQATSTQAVSGTVTVNPTAPTVTNAIINSAATTNGTVLKATAGTVYSVTVSNINASPRAVKLFNSATVTVGTTTPAILILCPAGATVTVPFGAMGARFSAGICLGITANAADNDTTAVAAGEVKVITAYI